MVQIFKVSRYIIFMLRNYHLYPNLRCCNDCVSAYLPVATKPSKFTETPLRAELRFRGRSYNTNYSRQYGSFLVFWAT
jgi:hypothetical protein